MKTRLLTFCMLLAGFSYGGTPEINSSLLLYGLFLTLFGGIIFTDYFIKFVKRKLRESKEEWIEEDYGQEDGESLELHND